jgi:gamma-glutamylputrescine oxidase
MRATPLSDDYREEPVWWHDTRFPQIPAGPLPREADVAIIGAGYTGLCAALTMARHGKRVVVLDKDALGCGASGRNAGMIHAGLRRDIDWLERHRGPAGLALHAASVEACRFVASTAAELAPDASWRESGWVHLAHRASAMTGPCQE